MYLTFFTSFRGTAEQEKHLHESPALITFPLIVLAILAALGGAINLPGSTWLNHYLAPLFQPEEAEHALGSLEYGLMGVALAGGVFGILWARRQFIIQKSLPKADEQMEGFAKVVYHKYYVDEAYMRLIVNPINSASRFFRDTVETSLSAVVFGLGKVTLALGAQGRKVHNGNTGLYLFAFVLGVIALVTYLFIVQ